MADRFWGRLEFPVQFYLGDVKDSLDDYRFENQEFIDGLVRLEDSQAANGRFDELEELLIENNVPFDRVSDSYCEFSAEVRYFRPDVMDVDGQPFQGTYLTDEFNGDIVVVAKDIYEIIKQGKGDSEIVLNIQKFLNAMAPIIKPLSDYCDQAA